MDKHVCIGRCATWEEQTLVNGSVDQFDSDQEKIWKQRKCFMEIENTFDTTLWYDAVHWIVNPRQYIEPKLHILRDLNVYCHFGYSICVFHVTTLHHV